MAVNRGKSFETEIKKALDKAQNVSVDRVHDSMSGFAGVKNICDFTAFRTPYKYYLECKETESNVLNFKGAISEYQWNGLLKKAEILGVISGYCVWYFRHGKTFFIPAKEAAKWRGPVESPIHKSMHIDDILLGNIKAVEIPGKKRKIMFTYDGDKMLDAIDTTVPESHSWRWKGIGNQT